MELTATLVRRLAVAVAAGFVLTAVGCGDTAAPAGDPAKPGGRTLPGAPAKAGAAKPK